MTDVTSILLSDDSESSNFALLTVMSRVAEHCVTSLLLMSRMFRVEAPTFL